MSYWEDRLGHRPPVSVNFAHLLDMAGRDPLLLRSGLDEIEIGFSAILEKFEHDSHGRGHLMAVGDPLGALLQSFLAEQALDRSSSFVDPNGVLQPRFSEQDLGLLREFPGWRVQVSAPRVHPIRGIDLLDIPDDAKIAIFGDWGFGTRGSRLVSESIARASADVVIHLGDVYYSGTDEEVRGYLCDVWPVDPQIVPSRACNSNHEMYAGGRAFEQTTLPFLRQSSSLFALRNASWLLIGLDTGTIDGELGADQVQLVLSFLAQNPAHNVALLSHHPVYSLEAGIESRMRETAEPLLASGRVSRWYSAHEHAAVVFPEDKFGVRVRCVGNGGFPYLLPVGLGIRGRTHAREETWLPSAAPGLGSVEVGCGPSQYAIDGSTYGPEGWVELSLPSARGESERFVWIGNARD